jgi:hypothetical protein
VRTPEYRSGGLMAIQTNFGQKNGPCLMWSKQNCQKLGWCLMSGLNQILRFKLGLVHVWTRSPQVVSRFLVWYILWFKVWTLWQLGLTTVLYTVTAVQNTVLYGCGPYRNRTRTRKTQALDGTVTVINGRITAPYGSTSIISIWDIMYVCVWSPNLIIGLSRYVCE